jgi:hypothetical protein
MYSYTLESICTMNGEIHITVEVRSKDLLTSSLVGVVRQFYCSWNDSSVVIGFVFSLSGALLYRISEINLLQT